MVGLKPTFVGIGNGYEYISPLMKVLTSRSTYWPNLIVPSNMNFKSISLSIEDKVSELLRSFVGHRRERRLTSIRAMIEKRISRIGKGSVRTLLQTFRDSSRRTIFDFACMIDGQLFGFDVKIRPWYDFIFWRRVCAVGIVEVYGDDKGIFVIAEFGHNKSGTKTKVGIIEYIRIAPFHSLPSNTYRIENLGQQVDWIIQSIRYGMRLSGNAHIRIFWNLLWFSTYTLQTS